MTVKFVAVLFATFVVVALVVAQAPQPTLRILFPTDGVYVADEVLIKAAVEPPTQSIQRMTFSVDGGLICTVERPPFGCSWNAGFEVREHDVRVVAYLADGRRLVQHVRTKKVEFADEIEVPRVLVTVSVLEGSKFVRGLDRQAFRVYEDDVQHPITYFASGNVSLELITAVDVSRSMAPAIDGVKANVKRFLSALRPADRVWLVGFNENFFVAARPSVDSATRLKAVDRLASWGMTSLYEIIIRSFDLLGKQTDRRGLVIFTDGEDTSSRVPREEVERRAQKSDAVLYMIGAGKAIESVPLRSLCERLAERSGGRAFFPADLAALHTTFDHILEELSNQYVLGYVRPSLKPNSTWHRIRVEVEHGQYQVRARQGYLF